MTGTDLPKFTESPKFMGLRRLGALERRFDGPVPEAERSLLLLGSVTAMVQRQAKTEAAFFAALVRRQIHAIRGRRSAGSMPADLLEDLASYRRQRRAWRRFAAHPRDGEAPPAEGGASVRWVNHHPIHDRV
jgi:hypothetical protein